MEQMEQRKEKAAELSSGRHASTDYAPKLTPYERKKQCSLCNVLVCLSGEGGGGSQVVLYVYVHLQSCDFHSVHGSGFWYRLAAPAETHSSTR